MVSPLPNVNDYSSAVKLKRKNGFWQEIQNQMLRGQRTAKEKPTASYATGFGQGLNGIYF